MDRRATLAAFLGKKVKTSGFKPVLTGLTPYNGPWGFEQAAHLLRRAMFGPTLSQIQDAVNDGLGATLAQLLAPTSMPDPPVNYYYPDDPNVPVGETWIDAPYSTSVNYKPYRYQSLYGWTMGLILNEGVSLREKMTLFWHNHFVTANINDPKFNYRYISLLRQQALGNFRQLVKDITIDPAMLRYLNGNQNTKTAPNENYARELLELFTIGKGDQIAPGDYSHYTEDDVIEIARVLTGWKDTGFSAINAGVEVGSAFFANTHDTGTKQLSYHFNDAVIPNLGANEYSYLIDLIFEQEEVARFIARKLYRWFVFYEISAQVESDVIQPLAQVLIDNDFEMIPALEALLGSEHFFDALNIGPMIKNPVDFVATTLKTFQTPISTDLSPQYAIWREIFNSLIPMQMAIFNPPDVAGWKAYYQEPLFYRTWINSVTLPVRMELTNTVSTAGYSIFGQLLQLPVLDFIASLSDPLDPNLMIDEIARILFPQPITVTQKGYLKEILIPGLPDYEWTVEYADYLSDPGNTALAASVEAKVRALIQAMLSMPEFYLS